ncbi:hypothetical protein K474DRAFT_1074844 [Panus rudis PR-1116 ss-1]|nr:hypothetical protein K474DRAFT_1074844 [Panus rudis PR-1116 ss-1]
MSPDRTVRALKLPKGSRSKRPTISQCVGVTPAYLLCCLPCPFPFTHLQGCMTMPRTKNDIKPAYRLCAKMGSPCSS